MSWEKNFTKKIWFWQFVLCTVLYTVDFYARIFQFVWWWLWFYCMVLYVDDCRVVPVHWRTRTKEVFISIYITNSSYRVYVQHMWTVKTLMETSVIGSHLSSWNNIKKRNSTLHYSFLSNQIKSNKVKNLFFFGESQERNRKETKNESI